MQILHANNKDADQTVQMHSLIFHWVQPSEGTFSHVAVHLIQSPVVQSFVSLTSSLRVISLTVLADSIYNILILFAEKM